jgi:hypothetical protein
MGQQRENLEQWVRQTICQDDIESDELERVARRLGAVKAALEELTPLVIPENEPLTMAALEDE